MLRLSLEQWSIALNISNDVTQRVEQFMGCGNEGSILINIVTNNADQEGTTAIVTKYRELLKRTKQARAGQIMLSGILPQYLEAGA